MELTDIATSSGVSRCVPAIALKGIVTGSIQTSRKWDTLIASNPIPSHLTGTNIGSDTIAVLTSFGHIGLSGPELAHGSAAMIGGFRPTRQTDHLVVIVTNVVVRLLHREVIVLGKVCSMVEGE